MPSIDVKLDAPTAILTNASSAQAGPSLRAVPPAGYAANVPRWSLIWTDAKIGEPVRWRFTIERVEAGGLAPVFHREGVGAPPAVIDWNGLNDAGTAVAAAVHVARLTLVADDGTEVASRRQPFGVGVGGTVRQEIIATGKLFTDRPRGPEVSTELREKVQAIASQLGDSGSVAIAVHGDGSGDRLKSLVKTQTEAKKLQELFVGLGIVASQRVAQVAVQLQEFVDADASGIADLVTVIAAARTAVLLLGSIRADHALQPEALARCCCLGEQRAGLLLLAHSRVSNAEVDQARGVGGVAPLYVRVPLTGSVVRPLIWLPSPV